MPQRVILDVDTGTDDAVALMLAALHPDIDLIAATVVGGNVPLENCVENTLRVFDHIGVPVPVYPGMGTPLIKPAYPGGSAHIHGEYLDIPAATTLRQPTHAVDYLIDTFLASDRDIILVPTGSMTNVAMAMRMEPRIIPRIKEIVFMGGGHEIGNVTPSAEANIWRDPEGARVMIQSGVPMRMVPLDATHTALISYEDCERFRAIGTPAAIATAIFVERRIKAYDEAQPMRRKGTTPLHDPLCIAAIIDPSILETRHLYVDVETFGEITRGRTVVDSHHRSGKSPNVHVAFKADEQRFREMLMTTFS